MSLTQGCLNLYFLLQKPLKPPLYLDPVTRHQIPRHSLRVSEPKFLCFSSYFTLWKIIKFNVFFLFHFAFWRCIWLFSNISRIYFEQLGFYGLMLTITSIGLSSYDTFDSHVHDACFAITQRFNLIPTHHLGWPIFAGGRRLPRLGEAFIYCFAFSTITIPVFFGAIPIFRNYDPVQLVFSKLFTSTSLHVIISVKIAASIILGFHALHGAIAGLCVILEILMFVEAVQELSFRLFHRSASQHVIRFRIKDQRTKPKLLISLNLQFSKCLPLFRELEILIRVGNSITSNFLANLVGMGTCACACGGYVMLKLYEDLPLIIYLSCSVFFFICLTVNFLLIYLADIPFRNGEHFKHAFKRELLLRDKYEQLQLKACPSIAYEIGTIVRKVQRSTSLSIANSIFNLTATLVVMRI